MMLFVTTVTTSYTWDKVVVVCHHILRISYIPILCNFRICVTSGSYVFLHKRDNFWFSNLASCKLKNIN